MLCKIFRLFFRSDTESSSNLSDAEETSAAKSFTVLPHDHEPPPRRHKAVEGAAKKSCHPKHKDRTGNDW